MIRATSLLLLTLMSCTTTLEFENGTDTGAFSDAGSANDAGNVNDTGNANDAGAPDDTGARSDGGSSPALIACRLGCEAQTGDCSSFNASLCFELCEGADDARRSGFAQCTDGGVSMFSCNLGFDSPSCFAMLSGGVEAEAQCRQACDRYEECDFIAVSAVCRDRCVTRLPADNEVFVECVADDQISCTLRCL